MNLCAFNTANTASEMGQADEATRSAVRAKSFILFIAIVDFITLGVTAFILIYFCSGDTNAVQLSLWHGGHIIMIITACVVFPIDDLFVPLIFGLFAMALFVIDVVILVIRAQQLLDAPNIFSGCGFFLLLTDVFFLLFSIFYVVATIRTAKYYGVFGDPSETERDPFLPYAK